MSDFHRKPDPRKVAEVVDCYGWDQARERWGWCGATLLGRLAAEGRRLAGRKPPTGELHALGTSQSYVAAIWDGPECQALHLTPSRAAAALGMSQSALRRQ